jgi:hypothetical protein
VRKLLSEVKTEPVKIVIFDLISEYTGLLLNQLVNLDKGFIVNIGAQTTPESVLTPAHRQPRRQHLDPAPHLLRVETAQGV